MDIEKEIEECESILKKIKQFDPDPYYINYFFNAYLFSVNKIFVGIFEEANRDFGLFITGVSPIAYALLNCVVAIVLITVLGKKNLSRRERVCAG